MFLLSLQYLHCVHSFGIDFFWAWRIIPDDFIDKIGHNCIYPGSQAPHCWGYSILIAEEPDNNSVIFWQCISPVWYQRYFSRKVRALKLWKRVPWSKAVVEIIFQFRVSIAMESFLTA